ncbi:hypothetical protein ACIA8R_46120 [Nonomuraea sp. NPDC051191]|uniref:hypothetical protein n=1 Tax=Nonomuraea sp. NPDC051191 TaxID=3364372 RepID=UPI0037A38012
MWQITIKRGHAQDAGGPAVHGGQDRRAAGAGQPLGGGGEHTGVDALSGDRFEVGRVTERQAVFGGAVHHRACEGMLQDALGHGGQA